MSNTRILPWVVLIGLIAFSAATYAGLPAEIPTKISARGVVTNTAAKSLFNWFLLVGVAGLTQALLTWLTLRLPKQPELFNFSEKERFLRLAAEYQRPVIVRMQLAMDIIGTCTMLILAYVQWMIYRTATGVPQTQSVIVLIIFTIVFAPITFLLVGRVSAEVDVQERRARSGA